MVTILNTKHVAIKLFKLEINAAEIWGMIRSIYLAAMEQYPMGKFAVEKWHIISTLVKHAVLIEFNGVIHVVETSHTIQKEVEKIFLNIFLHKYLLWDSSGNGAFYYR
jgi:hypothetical protein